MCAVVTATNRIPDNAVAEGKLREDLLYRLNVFPIRLPPLRERSERCPVAGRSFPAGHLQGRGQAQALRAAAASMNAYDWPGNVRELRNVVQRAFVMAEDGVITNEWLELESQRTVRHDDGPVVSIRVGSSLAAAERELVLATLEHFGGQKERTAAALGVSLKTLYNRLKEYSADGFVPQGSNGNGSGQPAESKTSSPVA